MGKMARNEKRKLLATLANSVAAGLILAATLSVSSGAAWEGVIPIFPVAVAFHLGGRAILRRLED